MSAVQLLRTGVIALVGAVYLWLGHQASISADPPLASLLIGLAPLSLSALLLAWASRSLWLIGLCAGALLLMLTNIEFLRANTPWVYFVQHAGMHSLLGIMFARTLSRDHAQALCSKVSYMVWGDQLDAPFYLYTWRVTWVWTAYFALATLASVLLFWLAPLAWWSVFANLLTPVLIGAIFVIEFAVRQRVLPKDRHASIAQTIRAYREYSARKD
jgi:uncharacterized membrane protein